MRNNPRGFIATYTVLIVLTVVIAVTLTVTRLSIGSGQSSQALYQGENSLFFSEGCVEDALLKARNSSAFGDPVGNPVTIGRPEGSCLVTVVSKSGVAWTMTVSINISPTPIPGPSLIPANPRYTRTVRVIFNRNPNGIDLTSWQEI